MVYRMTRLYLKKMIICVYIFSQSRCFFSTWSRLCLNKYPKIIIRKNISIMTEIDLNEIDKIIYCKYKLLFKVLYIIGVKPSLSFKTKHYKN